MCAHADARLHFGFKNPVVEGSALLELRELRVLGVAAWHIHLKPTAFSSRSNGLAELPLTELHASTWRHDGHGALLDAALRGGTLTWADQKAQYNSTAICLHDLGAFNFTRAKASHDCHVPFL